MSKLNLHYSDVSSIWDWIDSQETKMLKLLKTWAEINSSSDNLEGLAEMKTAIITALKPLMGTMKEIPLPPRVIIDETGAEVHLPVGKALYCAINKNAKRKIFLGGHMDTVYPKDHPFQKCKTENGRLIGPGVADMKGGLLVMIFALQAFLKLPIASQLGFEIFINPDEEVGSVSSEKLLNKFASDYAKKGQIALLFEPAFYDGSIVSARKGSMNATVIAQGKAAHAGRNFSEGRNAVVAIAKFAALADKLTDLDRGVTVNIGAIIGGGPVNVVSERALCRLNVRVANSRQFNSVEKALLTLVRKTHVPGTTLKLVINSRREPKPFDAKSKDLFEKLQQLAKEENVSLKTRESGGVCDGNIFAASRVPVLDTLGVVGGCLHSPDEYMEIASLRERTRLVFLLLRHLAMQHKGSFS